LKIGAEAQKKKVQRKKKGGARREKDDCSLGEKVCSNQEDSATVPRQSVVLSRAVKTWGREEIWGEG